MQSEYRKIWKFAHQEIYTIIKLSNISFDEYIFETYFDYIIQKNNIKVSSHNFTNKKITGLTLILNEGTSIAYRKSDIPARQNFTKCHEIGHIVLNHHAKIGAYPELEQNNKPKELEADFFASILLAPDIILYHKIIEKEKNFQDLCYELKISQSALFIRLSYLIQVLTNKFYIETNEIVEEFKNNPIKTTKLYRILNNNNNNIEEHFSSTIIDKQKELDYLFLTTPFISSLEFEELLNKEYREKISKKYNNFKFWAIYNRGKTIWYCWNTQTFNKKTADLIANTLLYEEIY